VIMRNQIAQKKTQTCCRPADQKDRIPSESMIG